MKIFYIDIVWGGKRKDRKVDQLEKRDTGNILGLAGLVVAGVGVVLAYLEYTNQYNC